MGTSARSYEVTAARLGAAGPPWVPRSTDHRKGISRDESRVKAKVRPGGPKACPILTVKQRLEEPRRVLVEPGVWLLRSVGVGV